MFASPKVPVRLKRRDKRVKRHLRVIERYHKARVELAYAAYYKDAIY